MNGQELQKIEDIIFDKCIRLVTCCTRTGSNVTGSLTMWGRVSGSERILFTVGSTLMISDLLDRILGIYPYCIYLATSTSRHLDASEAPGEDND